MIASIRKAYGAGYRAGMAPRRLVRPGGTRGIKVLLEPINPYKGWRCIAQRLAFDMGVHDGTLKSISTWLNGRKIVSYREARDRIIDHQLNDFYKLIGMKRP